MGAYIPGMEEHNAVNNDDGFTTGFIGKPSGNNVNLVPPQGYMQDPVEPPMGNTQQMPQQPMMNNQQPMGNTQQMPMMNNQQPMGNTQQMPMMNNQQPMPEQMPQPQNNNEVPEQDVNHKGTSLDDIGKRTGADMFEEKKKTVNKIKPINLMENSNIDLSKILKYVAIGVIAVLVIFIILYFTGVFKHDEPVEDEPVVDVQKEQEEKMFYKLNSTCSNLDENGNFGTNLEPIAGCDTLTCNILNNVVCTEGFCMISDGKTVYSKNCTNGNTNTAEVNAFQAQVNLGDACEALKSNRDLNGNLDASFATCENYLCTTIVNGEKRSKDCSKDS